MVTMKDVAKAAGVSQASVSYAYSGSGRVSQAQREIIFAAAARLGKAKEIDRIGAQEIAAEAGVALRTLYRYYPSKYHVFEG